MTDAQYEAKFKEMQKYIPFLQRVIEKLKVNNEQQAENPRKAQLQKMEMLHELLTNKAKKIKMETLIKCEGVLIKLHAKIEKQTTLLQSDDSILNNVKLKPVFNNPSTSNTTTQNAKDVDLIDLSGPASPPPEIIPIDIDQPVVIPTERRCSPILVEEEPGFTRRSGYHSKTEDKYDHHKKSSDKQYSSESHAQDSRQSINNSNNNSKHSHDSIKHDYHRHHHHHSHYDSRKDGHNAKDYKPIPTHVSSNRRSENLPKEDQIKRDLSKSKSPTTSQKLHTVKVVITEPLGDHVKQKHFPTANKLVPRASICHDNLKTLPQVNNADCGEAYSPEELWKEYNDSNKKTNSPSSKPSVFNRLGEKVVEPAQTFSHSNTKSSTSITGRYTPIPDVLKSPPLSVTDINNLLLESGLEKDPNDISEIGSRRAPKTEGHQIKMESSPSNTLEFARRKLAQTAKLYSPNSEAQKSPLSTENPLSSPLPNERIALKYNPHPRQERLQSISSTEGSECSISSKIIDPRIKSKLPSSNLINPINVNVLPTINMSDPRLKKQNTNTYEKNNTLSPTPTGHNQLPGYVNPNLISYAGKVDPRMSRVANNPLSASQIMPPYGRSSTNKPNYNCEEKWSTMESADKPRVQTKSNPRVEKRDTVENKFDARYCANKNISLNAMPNRRRSICQSRFVSGSETEYVKPNPPKSDSEEDWDKDLEKEKQIVKEKSVSQHNDSLKSSEIDKKNVSNSKNSNVTTDIRNKYIPRPPNSDTEEDWDSEPEPEPTTSKTKSNVSTNASPNILTSNPSVPELITPVRIHVSPKAFVNILKTPLLPLPPQHSLQHSYGHSPHQIAGATSLQSTSTSPANIRFNALLNDKTEREKYLESKKQKPFQPRTYKEFREAKERQQAQAAAMKRAAEAEAEAKKRAEELKEAAVKDNATNACEKKEHKTNVPSKVVESKVEKNHNQSDNVVKMSDLSKDHAKTLAPESTLDKMYRTQNFGSTFPKASTSFKIPKKKSEEKPKEETTNKMETKKETLNDTLNQESGKNLFTEKSKNVTERAAIDSSHIENTNNMSTKIKETKDNQNKNPKHKQTNKEENTPETVATTDSKDEVELSKQTDTVMLTKKSIRDPRCRSKNISNEIEENLNTKEESMHGLLNDIIIKSSENEVVLKPQQQQKLENLEDKNKSALEKFNEITKTLSPKPQRIMRRRNTMVAFESEPLVDKDKLRKANAMLFEDIHEEEKRKQKQKEEDRQNARRKKNLEEMFQKTDDNCTVSTQNIITGKRRTRATINFNETVNAMNVFKHTSKKGSAGSTNSTPTAQPSPQTNGKNTRLNPKRAAKSSDVLEDNTSIEDECENVGKLIENKETKTSNNVDTSKSSEELNSSNDGTKIKPIKTKLKLCIKLPKKRPPAYIPSPPTPTATTTATTKEVKKEAKFKPIQDEEHQNCAVSSTSTENPSEDQPVCSTSSSNSTGSFKNETDDNEPTSTASKSNNSTPTPEASVQVLEEIVDKMLKPNADRVHILSLLGQILSDEKLELIKSLIHNNTQQLDEQETNKEEDSNKPEMEENEEIDAAEEKPSTETNEQEENPDEKPMKQKKSLGSGKKIQQSTKKKRTELDRLNEDIRDMFICEGVLTATGRRMCTIMGQSNNKDSESSIQNKSTPDTSPTLTSGNDNMAKKKKELRSHADKNKMSTARPLRRSVRGCKTANEDDETETTEESIDERNITSESNSTDSNSTPQRKMPVLKPNTPIKILEEEEEAEEQIDENVKKVKNKRKSDTKSSLTQPKKVKKTNKDDLKDNTADSECEKESELGDVENDSAIKNTNIHWHNQSKFTTWCMICEKRLQASSSALHYKIHHAENYISRLAPIILQQFKQGKLCKPLFGVDKSPKQSSWFYRCPFCLQYFNTTLPLWIEHFHNHTTEFRYECSKCHRGSNKAATIRRHVKYCGGGATMLNSAIKLSIPTLIKGHVCHLCNFLQLRRSNLERHYIEQHNIDKNTVELLGHTITLFDVENIELVSEANATERENEAWEFIEKDEKVIDVDDDEDRNPSTSEAEKTNTKVDECVVVTQCVKEVELENEESFKSINDPTTKVDAKNINEETQMNTETKISEIENQGDAGDHETRKENHESENAKDGETAKDIDSPEESVQHIKVQSENIESSTSETVTVAAVTNFDLNETETGNSDYELINERETAQDIQDELLALAGKAAENNEDNNDHITAEIQVNETNVQPQTSISDIISSSIDMIYSRDAISYNSSGSSSSNKRKSSESDTTTSEAKKSFPNVISNVFMPTRDENNSSPTIQILAQSIINIEEEAQQSENPLKSISIAERLSQRFKGLQNRETLNSSPNITTEITETNAKERRKENPFEKLINDTVLELEREKDSLITMSQCETTDKRQEENEKSANHRAEEESKKKIEIENENENEKEKTDERFETITVLSDDEDWEDIEITETAPVACAANTGNIQKSKSKGLFQKFGIFKGNTSKSKKHIQPLVFLPKKKTKEKSLSASTTSSPSPTTATKTNTTALTATKSDAQITHTNTHVGFKPVANIMDDLLPDSPCNDPIDLVPELAPLEPLQDLNDISSILDSHLSGALDSSLNMNASEHHASIEDALDFISEQQASDTQLLSSTTLKSLNPSQGKTIIHSMSHVGYSIHNTGENVFKFYCLLQNCSFLFSSDSIGLETHFMCEHSQIKWDGHCLMCQTQCFPLTEHNEGYPISKEIRHMMEKHVNKQPNIELNTDSTTQHSTTSSQGSEERPKIKLRRLTGDCLSRAALEEHTGVSNPSTESVKPLTNNTVHMSMLGALLVAKPKPPTKEMPPQPQMPLTEPLLLDNNIGVVASSSNFKNMSNDFLITSVTSAADTLEKQSPMQISNVISLQGSSSPMVGTPEQTQLPTILNVRTLAPEVSDLWPQQSETDHQDVVESATESLEVSQILANAGKPSLQRDTPRAMDDSPGPVVVAETVPLAQNKTGEFLITQTVSAQYNDCTSAAVGFNISIAAAPSDKSNKDALPVPSSIPVTSRHYRCMANGCKFISRVRVAMSDHLRFHERRNFSNKRDYFDCGFCSYHASDLDDYMKHTDQYHIINKSGGGAASVTSSTSSESDTANSLTKKIHDILNSTNGSSRNNTPNQLQIQSVQVQDSHEVYLKKLKDTIDEIVGPTGLADDQLYRCVVKNCRIQLTETTFLNHIMFHISTTSTNPNNYIFKCPHCTAQYHRAAGIKAHIKNHARNRYFCYLCDHTSTNPGQLLKHFSEKHWHTLNMYTHELLKAKTSTDGSAEILDSAYYVVYTQELSEEEVRKFGEKLILEWQRKKSGSKTHFKSTEIELLPLSAIFKHEVNCGECEYKTKVRTNMYRHLQMHKQNRGLSSNSGVSKVCSVDPVNPVPCLNSNERFFDKMTNLASSSLVPSSYAASNSSNNNSNSAKTAFKIPYKYIVESKRYSCGSPGCIYLTISEDNFRTHIATLHSSVMSYRCAFCQEEICKRGITIDRIVNHLRFHGATLYRCEECNYVHHLRYVVERHINEKHATLKVNLITHERSSEDNAEGTMKILQFTGKKYRETMDNSNVAQTSASTALRSTNNEPSTTMSTSTNNTAKGKGKWICDVCGHRASNVSQIQNHCQQQHGVKNQYKCAHCNFGSQQLSQILYHIDEKHSGKTREARYMYHKTANTNEEVADTRPLWQRNDPTRIRHIRGILMEDEEESEQYRKKLGLTEDLDDDDETESANNKADEEENNDELDATNYIKGYEFGCFHCDFKTQVFEDLKTKHYTNVHNSNMEMAKPFWFRLHRRLCCPECRSFIGNCNELQQHIQNIHKRNRYYAADITVAENEDSSHRIQCGYCSFHCANVEHLYKHHIRTQHLPQDIRLDDNKQLADILNLGQQEVTYQCSLCSEIFSNRVAIVQHACIAHSGDSFSFKDLKNTCIYHCIVCNFASTEERVVLRHMIDHYSRFAVCQFCRKKQSSFNVYMQHCYAEHRTDIQKFKTIYTLSEIRKYLMKMYVILPNGLVLTKRNLLNTIHGSTYVIEELYEEMYKISQQPPIPRLSIARLVARKSIEAQQKQYEPVPIAIHQAEILEVMQSQSRVKTYSRRKSTVAGGQEDQVNMPTIAESKPATIKKRRTTVYHDNPIGGLNQTTELQAPEQPKKISKRRRTVAVDRDTLFSTNLSSSADSLLIERELIGKKPKLSNTPSSPQHHSETGLYPLNLDMEPFSFYGQKPEAVDLSKIYTKVVIGGIKTPLTIDKFKLLFDIECQLKLTKCDDEINEMLAYKDYKHIKKACPASHKLKYK